jgi:hypothetical protein
MLIDEIKQRMFKAMKAGDTVEKEILRTAIGEVTRVGDAATDEKVAVALRKLVKANQETIGALPAGDVDRRSVLEREIGVLEGFLPKALSQEQIRGLLEPVAAQLRAASGPGPAMGIAMKHLKAQNAVTESRDVQAALEVLRRQP